MKLSFNTLLVAVVVVGLAIGAGLAAVQRNAQTTPASASAATGGQAQRNLSNTTGVQATGSTPTSTSGQAVPGPGTGGLAGQRPVANGTVDSIAGNLVAVKTVSGTVQVTVSDSTTIRKTVTSSIADLKAGETVTVSGAAGSDGTIAATAIQTIPGGSLAAGAPQAGPRGQGIQGQGTGGASGQTGQGQGTGGTGGQAGRGQGAGGAGSLPGQGGQGQGTGGTGQRPATFGTIDSVDGNSLTLSGPTGPVKVTVTGETVIRIVMTAKISDLKVGETVTVVGTANSDGTVNATTIQSIPTDPPTGGR